MQFGHFDDYQKECGITRLDAPRFSINKQGITGKLLEIGDFGSDGAGRVAREFPAYGNSIEGAINSLSIRMMPVRLASRRDTWQTELTFAKTGRVA
jgi:hypothetical protein